MITNSTYTSAKKTNHMVKTVTKFNVPCYFAGKKSQVAIYIGEPEQTHHPIFFQAKFIQDERGGVIPQEIMDSLSKLKQLAVENGVPFEELCRYALSSLSSNGDDGGAAPTPQQVEASPEPAKIPPTETTTPAADTEVVADAIPATNIPAPVESTSASTTPSANIAEEMVSASAIAKVAKEVPASPTDDPVIAPETPESKSDPITDATLVPEKAMVPAETAILFPTEVAVSGESLVAVEAPTATAPIEVVAPIATPATDTGVAIGAAPATQNKDR